MERLLVVSCPSLLSIGEQGEELRSLVAVLDAVGELCPWVEVVRPGVCALPARGPSRFFGGERALVARVAAVARQVAADARVGVADGLFAALLAARSELIVPSGGTREFLGPWSVTVLRRPELAVTLQRLGINNLGRFAALAERDVSARFGADAVSCHRVARGEEGELEGLRDTRLERLLQELGGPVTGPGRQQSFFGGRSAAERRAEASFARVQRRLGPGAVLTARLTGGRDPADRVVFVPWDGRDPRGDRSPDRSGTAGTAPDAPWPGRLPPPSPVTVPPEPRPVELVDRTSARVEVTGRGLLLTEPVRLSLEGGPWQDVAAWAGPWPANERWWSSRRRRARLQVVTADDVALLLASERERWWLLGLYD